MKSMKYVGKIEAVVLGTILITTGLVSAGAVINKQSLNSVIPEEYPDWIKEQVYIEGKTKPESTCLIVNNDEVHIFYITKDKQLKHSYKPIIRWVDETLDNEVTGKYVTAEIDTTGVFHISYGKEQLLYLTGRSMQWEKPQVVDPDNCLTENCFVSLDLDSDNNPHISYYDGVNKDLKYASKTGLNWDITLIDSFGNVGKYNSLSVDTQDRIHIAYYDASNKDLKYTIKTDLDWQTTVVDLNNKFGIYASIAVDSNDLPHIVHSGTDGVKHTFKVNSKKWDEEIIDLDQTQCFCPSIKIDDEDTIHVGYSKTIPGGPDLKFDLMYAKKKADQWQIETAIDAEPFKFFAYGISINLDSNNDPGMSYVDFIGEKSLEYVYRNDPVPDTFPSEQNEKLSQCQNEKVGSSLNLRSLSKKSL